MQPVKSILTVVVVMTLTACSPEPPAKQEASVSSVPALPQKAPDEAAALAAITRVNAAQKDYFARNRRYALSYEELREGFFLKDEPTVEGTGYDIRLRPAADAASYSVLAAPSAPSPAVRHFFSDQTGTIRAEQSKDANAQSAPVSE